MIQEELFNDGFMQRVSFTPSRNWLRSAAARNYGIIGTKIIFALIGPKGAVTWTLSPNWYIKSCREHLSRFDRKYDPFLQPEAHDLSYHGYAPQYEDQTCRECDLLSGGKCFSDDTSLRAKELVEGFLAGGDKWLWSKLREVYESWFNAAPWPDFTPQYEPHPDDKEPAP